MKKYFSQITLLIGMLLFASCTEAQKKADLSATTFSQRTKEQANITILDVRTPREYAGGHLKNSLNIDWEGDAFEKGIAQIDKQKPVYIYCHSGRRSAAAANEMRKMGFEV